MEITIVGGGKVGRALARRFLAAGHEVRIASRHPASPSTVAEVPLVRLEEAAHADVVLLATPAAAVEEVVPRLGGLDGTVVVDATNPFGLPDGASTVAVVQAAAPGARVVKAFNTLGFDVLADPTFGDGRPVLTVCGDDDGAVARVVELAASAGFEPLVLGLEQHDLAEAFARLWITLSRSALGRDFAFGLLRR